MVSKDWEEGLIIGMSIGTTIVENIDCPIVMEMSLTYSSTGVTVTKDTVDEVWIWVKDESGNITGMTSDSGRVVSVA